MIEETTPVPFTPESIDIAADAVERVHGADAPLVRILRQAAAQARELAELRQTLRDVQQGIATTLREMAPAVEVAREFIARRTP